VNSAPIHPMATGSTLAAGTGGTPKRLVPDTAPLDRRALRSHDEVYARMAAYLAAGEVLTGA
jgi:hypothetical protein